MASRAIPDGPEQTILLVEVAISGIHWAEPRDLPFEQALYGVNPPHVELSISGNHAAGVHAWFCDHHVAFLQNSTPADVLRALLTRNGGEPLVFNERSGEYELPGEHR